MTDYNSENSVKLKFAEDIATLKSEVANFKVVMTNNHKEIIEEFRLLRSKVNEEITTMQNTIERSRKQFWRALILVFVLGSFIWIKESRDFILKNIFNIL